MKLQHKNPRMRKATPDGPTTAKAKPPCDGIGKRKTQTAQNRHPPLSFERVRTTAM
jgi:hypothetical protein